MTEQKDCVGIISFTWQQECEFINCSQLQQQLSQQQLEFLKTVFSQTHQAIRNYNLSMYYDLSGKSIKLRLAYDCQPDIYLAPHELVLNKKLLNFSPKNKDQRLKYLIGLIYSGLFHFCNPDYHISQVNHSSFCFYNANPDICDAAIKQLQTQKGNIQSALWADILAKKDLIAQIESFWNWTAKKGGIIDYYNEILSSKNKPLSFFKDKLLPIIKDFSDEQKISNQNITKILTKFVVFFENHNSVVFVYQLSSQIYKVIRLRARHHIDTMAAPAACRAFEIGDICIDVFYDFGAYLQNWISNLNVYAKDINLSLLTSSLLCDDFHTVNSAIKDLVKKIRRNENPEQTKRILYAALYHSSFSDKALSKSIRYRVSRLLEDILTERPYTFPQSRTNKSVFRGEKAVIKICITKPYRIKKENIAARLQWSVNGNRKRTLPLNLDKNSSTTDKLIYTIELPVRKGWAHYCVQASFNAGKTWHYENLDPNSQGLIKFIPDERGQRILSIYADTFNLKLDENLNPVRDETGTYKYGTFDELAEQLENIKAEGYTRIYPLGALELGWAGEAGPDPSVFSIWDGKTVRRDLGGIEGLLRLKKRADQLNMKIILCVVSHFSKAHTNYPYRLPVYIKHTDGKLVRRAGWDGEWDQWHDSYMVNMRDFENIEYLTGICQELSGLGFGLRIDVGHGFDTVFPADNSLSDDVKLFGDIILPGFETIDLRGTKEANIPILYASYRTQKVNPSNSLFYSEQWHGNESRMIKSGSIPYNAVIKNLENIRSSQGVNHPLGLNDNIKYLQNNYHQIGGQTLSLFNSHDEESPVSNYQNMIWTTAAFLVFSSYGPLMYHISRLPNEEAGSFEKKFNLAYLECWKHWVNNRFAHPWQQEAEVRENLAKQYPLLKGFGTYLRGLFNAADQNPALTKGAIYPLETNNSRIAAFFRSYGEYKVLCVFNFPNPYTQGQNAVARDFNFTLKIAGENKPVTDISPDDTYELQERYNNTEGRHRLNKRQYWYGQELLELGFGGILPPVSSHIYEVIYRDHKIHEASILPDSFERYFRYGKDDRVKHTFIAKKFIEACENPICDFHRFAELFKIVAEWLLKYRKFGSSDFSIILGEICQYKPEIQDKIINYLMQITINQDNLFQQDICKAAGDILQSINIGPVVLVSPESKFSGSSGGVGIYTTDIADVLGEMGFSVIIVTPMYECNRKQIFEQYNPKYQGHSFNINFPIFRDDIQRTQEGSQADTINLYKTRITRFKHGKRATLDVFYLENAKYFDQPYGGKTFEDKLRRTRMLSQGALEAIRTYNIYPSIIQTNEWTTWLLPAYLQRWDCYRNDPHLKRTQVLSIMHNPHPSYSISTNDVSPSRREHYARVLGLDPLLDLDILINPNGSNGHEINLTYIMLKTSPFVGTVSRAMQERILAEPWLFGHSRLFQEKYQQGRFFGRRNGFNMGARQRFWFGGKNSLLETYSHAAQKRLFAKYSKIKKTAKLNLQNDPNIRISNDDDEHNHIIFGMLHRICKQKGFELLVDWKVYHTDGGITVQYDPANTACCTVLEHFLANCPLAQFVICGHIEDSEDGRRFSNHFLRIKNDPRFSSRFGYFPQGALPTSLYRNVYLGSQFFVMPSGGQVGEPCGISQQEAHAGGTPVIAHHQDGLIRTVADRDFGDTNNPPNGIKFSGFTGQSLLEALMDAVEIYTKGQRRTYKDKNGNPKKLKYAELSYNALRTDHRWLRLLHDYAMMYAFIQEVPMPEHLHAVQLICDISFETEKTPAEVILQKGLTVPEGVEKLIAAKSCPIESVSSKAEQTLRLLCKYDDVRNNNEVVKILKRAEKSKNGTFTRV